MFHVEQLPKCDLSTLAVLDFARNTKLEITVNV